MSLRLEREESEIGINLKGSEPTPNQIRFLDKIKSNRSIAKVTNPVIETDLAEILKEIRTDQKKLLEEVNELKLGQAKIEGKIEALDEKLSGQIKALDTKVEQLDKRVGNQEFTNRGVLIGLIVVILGGAAKFFGIVGNP